MSALTRKQKRDAEKKAAKERGEDKSKSTAPVGFMPCFEFYAHSLHPLEKFFATKPAYVTHIRKFLDTIFECETLIQMKDRITGKEIKPIRTDSDEAKRVNKALKYPRQLYRIDYGDTALRLYFGFNPQFRIVDVVAIDLDHTYFN